MTASTLSLTLALLTIFAYWIGRQRSVSLVGGELYKLHSLPSYYGYLVAIWCAIPAFILMGLWYAFEGSIIIEMLSASLPAELRNQSPELLRLTLNDIQNLAAGNADLGEASSAKAQAAEYLNSLTKNSHLFLSIVILAVAVVGLLLSLRSITPKQRSRNLVESIVKIFLILCAGLAILTTIGIVLSVLFETIRFFEKISPGDFLFGLDWSPQTAIRADQVGSTGAFGMIPLFAGTMLIALIAMLVAAPIGLMSAIYLSEYANHKVRSVVKPLLEVLAGIPTVVYGFFAVLVVAPSIRGFGADFGLDVSSESALAAGLVMGIMIIPFVSSLSDDVIHAVPQAMRDGSYGMGATQSETIMRVILPAALPGIVASLLLAVSRAIGETMIVVMAAGLSANLTANPLEAVTTVTVQIVTLLVGDQEFDSAKTLAAFALGLVLFIVTLALNVFALHVVKKYREQYE